MHAYAPTIGQYDPAASLAAMPTRAKRDRLGDRFLLFLGIVLVGYSLGGKGFAYWGVKPLFIGEITLAFGMYYLFRKGKAFKILAMKEFIPLLLFMMWGLARTIPYYPTYQFDAIRDAVLWGYGLFAIVVCALFTARPERISNILPFFRKFTWIFLVLAPPLLVLEKIDFPYPNFPGGENPIIMPKGGDIACHTVGVFAYYCLFGRRFNPFLPLASIPFIIAMCITGRAAMVTFLGGVGIFCIFKPFNLRALRIVGVLVLGLILLWATDLTIGDKTNTRNISWKYIQDAIESIVTDKEQADMSGTKEWRMNWWKDIIYYTLGNGKSTGKFFWAGKGYGCNLAEESGYMNEAATGLRSPHNGHLTVLARSGVIGLGLWAMLQAYFGWLMLKNLLRAKRRKDWKWAGMFLSLLAYWAAFMANTTFDVFLEGPMGGVWFWSIYGFGIAAEWIFQRYPYVLYMEPPKTSKRKKKPTGAPPAWAVPSTMPMGAGSYSFPEGSYSAEPMVPQQPQPADAPPRTARRR